MADEKAPEKAAEKAPEKAAAEAPKKAPVRVPVPEERKTPSGAPLPPNTNVETGEPRSEQAKKLEPAATSTKVMFHDTDPELAPREPSVKELEYVVYRDQGIGNEFLHLVVGDGVNVVLKKDEVTGVPKGLAKLLHDYVEEEGTGNFDIEDAEAGSGGA